MKINICTWKACSDRFSEYIVKRLESDKLRFNLDKVIIEKTVCTWNCKVWPVVSFDNNMELRIDPIKASRIMLWKTFNNKKK